MTETEVARRRYRLLGPDGVEFLSDAPGSLGGHRGLKIYGSLDCPSALSWITRGHYVSQRVFFADEETAVEAGYRPCGRCMPEEYRTWKAEHPEEYSAGKSAWKSTPPANS